MIRVYLKRIIHFLPYALCYLLAFGFASICIITYGESFIFGDQYSYSQAEIAVCIADDSEYNEIGLNMVSQLDSVGETVELNKMDSEEEVMAAVSKGDCVAGIIIPEGFVNSLSTGENMQAQIYFKDDDSFIGKVVNDLLMTLANMLGTGQCVTITAYSYLSDKDISSSEMYAIGTEAQNRSIAYVLARSDLFDTESIDFLSTFSLKQKMTASYTVFLMVMSVFVFAYFYKGSNDAVMTRVKLSGKKPAVFFIMETGAVAVMMYILYLIVAIISNAASNLIISRYSRKEYPEITPVKIGREDIRRRPMSAATSRPSRPCRKASSPMPSRRHKSRIHTLVPPRRTGGRRQPP